MTLAAVNPMAYRWARVSTQPDARIVAAATPQNQVRAATNNPGRHSVKGEWCTSGDTSRPGQAVPSLRPAPAQVSSAQVAATTAAGSAAAAIAAPAARTRSAGTRRAGWQPYRQEPRGAAARATEQRDEEAHRDVHKQRGGACRHLGGLQAARDRGVHANPGRHCPCRQRVSGQRGRRGGAKPGQRSGGGPATRAAPGGRGRTARF